MPLVDVSLTFDQLGRQLLLLLREGGGLYLNWYNPLVFGREEVLITEGVSSCSLGFDMVFATGDPESDVLMFYVREGNSYMRVQRDKFAIEYPLTYQPEGEFYINDCYLCADFKFRVEFMVRKLGGLGWIPEDPIAREWVAETIITDD